MRASFLFSLACAAMLATSFVASAKAQGLGGGCPDGACGGTGGGVGLGGIRGGGTRGVTQGSRGTIRTARARIEGRQQSPPCIDNNRHNPDLFYNFYTAPTCGGTGAEMYLAPQPVPAHVGHTYYTYQPLMPHEMLYQHRRTYNRYYDGGRGMNRTRVTWYTPPASGLYDWLHYKLTIPH